MMKQRQNLETFASIMPIGSMVLTDVNNTPCHKIAIGATNLDPFNSLPVPTLLNRHVVSVEEDESTCFVLMWGIMSD
jgi:hypothetical protein